MKAPTIDLRARVKGLALQVRRARAGEVGDYWLSLFSGSKVVMFVQTNHVGVDVFEGRAHVLAEKGRVSVEIDPDDVSALRAWLDDVREVPPAELAVTRERIAEGRY